MSTGQLQALETKTRDILKKGYKELPVAKDLPRLAKRITILNSKGATLLQPADATPSGPYVKEIFEKLFEIFQETELTPKFEEGWEACFDEKKELEKVLDRLLAVYIPEDNCKSLRILKACNQGVISGAVLELKFALGIAHTTKDVPNSWFFTIRNGAETTTVTSTKREICVQGVFEFQWEFTLYFNTHTQDFKTISLKVADLVFHKPENTQKVEDVKRILSKYMRTDILLGIARDRQESKADETNATGFLLPGEKILLQSEEVEFFTLKSKKESGCAYITNYRIHFVPQPNKRKEVKTLREELSDMQCTDIPLAAIHKLKNQDVVKLWCKDLRIANFQFKESGPRDLFFITTKKYIPSAKDGFFSSTYFSSGGVLKSASSEGWRIYNPLKELERLALPADRWRISNINNTFALCPGYPTVIAVPQSIMDEELIICGKARDGRIPTPVFKHPNGAYLCRAKTPSKKSAEDDKYIEALQKANSAAFFKLELTEVKAHTPRNRSGSSLKEREELLPLDSIAALQESYQDLALLCYEAGTEGTDENWLSSLDKSKWLQQIQNILSTSYRIVELLEKGFPVLLQSEDDTDRIPQITSLVQLLVDPYFRTLNGFEILIEKEWMSFGHKFLKRSGVFKEKKETAPLFLQFLDAVWQISLQFPKAFEFNSSFLTELMYNRYSGLYGTFLSNSNQERISLAETTASLWSYFAKTEKIAEYLNGNYSTGTRLLVPSLSLKKLSFWGDYYLRWIFDAQSLSRAGPRTALALPAWPSFSGLSSGLNQAAETPRELNREPSFNLDGIEKLTSKQMAKFKELQTYIESLKKENANLQRKEKKRKEKYEKLKAARRTGSGSLKKERSYTTEDPKGTPSLDRLTKSGTGSHIKTSEAFPGISLHGDDDFEALVKRSPSKRAFPIPTTPR